MAQFHSVRELIDAWPNRQALSDDLVAMGYEASTDRVHKWAQSGAIPAKFHAAVVVCGRSRGLPVSAGVIVALHDIPTRTGAAA